MSNLNKKSVFLSNLFDTWNQNDICYLVLRNYEDLPSETENDVDVLIDPHQLLKTKSIIKVVSGKNGWVIHNIGEFSCTAIYLYNIVTMEQLHIDLMCGLRWHSFLFADHRVILNARLPFKNFYIPDPVHEAGINLLTRLIYSGAVKDKYKKKIQQVAQEADNQLEFFLVLYISSRLSRKIINQAADGQWNEIISMKSMIRRNIFIANFKHPLLLVSSLINDFFRLFQRLLSPPGLSIVFIGPDGCGKTSVANKIKQSLTETFSHDKGIHCHWKPILRDMRTEKTDDPHGNPARNQFISFLYFLYHYQSFLWGWWRFIQPVLFKNGLVVIDRYYYDFFVDQKRYRLNISKMIIKLGFIFVRKPDLIFCLDADPKILQVRKAEVSYEECKRQRNEYRLLLDNLRGGYLIDSSQEIEKVVHDVQTHILNFMMKRIIKQVDKLN